MSIQEKHIGQIIKEERKKLGMSAQKLADMVGVSRRAIVAWESGERNITLSNADKVFSELGMVYTIGGTKAEANNENGGETS